MARAILACGLLLAMLTPASAQAPGEAPPPRLRRWLDVQQLHLSSRFRWVESNTGRITSSTHQWQPQVRARMKVDRQGRFSLSAGAFGGSHFVSGWNNTGGGLGTFAGDFHVKHLYASIEPVNGVELQVGGLAMMRGETTEVTSYDNDAYLVGERIGVRRDTGRLAYWQATVGFIGDYRTPNVFRRLNRLGEWNYAQMLIGWRLGPRMRASADYTYEDTRDVLRQGMTAQMPSGMRLLRTLRIEGYQRLGANSGYGGAVAADLRVTPKLSVTAGVAHVDRLAGAPGYGPLNGDRYERGTRFFTQGTYVLTRDLSVGWFQGEAMGVRYPIPNEHRFEVLVTVNPTATLKARGVF